MVDLSSSNDLDVDKFDILSHKKTIIHQTIFEIQPLPKQALAFTCLQYRSFENTVGKGEIAHNEQFLLFPQCFLPLWRTLSFSSNSKLSSANSFTLEDTVFSTLLENSVILIKFKIVICKFFHFGRVLKFVVWERLKDPEEV